MIYSKYNKYIQYIVYISILLILALPLLPLAKPVYAATLDRTILSEGDQTQGQYQAPFGTPAGTFANLNSDDGNASVLYVTTSAIYHTYHMQTFVTTAASIDGVMLSVDWTSGDNSGVVQPYCRINGINYMGTAKGISVATVYQTNTESTFNGVLNKNPATGNAWTANDLNGTNDVEFGILLVNGTNYACATYFKMTVTYTPLSTGTVTTSTTGNITYSGGRCWADFAGEITATGGADATIWGFAWGTTCNSTTPASTQPPDTTSYTANYSYYGTHGAGTFSYTSNLTCCTTYCARAYTMNSVGWSWGNEITFVTMCDPDIDTQPATYVQATTARLNSLVIYDGEQACDVRFGYSTVSGNCTDDHSCTLATCTFNATSYNATTPWIENTYYTGDTPYVDISGLVVDKTYYYCAQIRNDMSCACGGEQSFTTKAVVDEPNTFKGIARSTEVSLFWIKGTGATYTLIRGKTGSYPTGILDGTQVYLDTQTSVVWTNLTPGTTYYLMAWSISGTTYSTSNTTLMITTLGASASTAGLPAPTTPTAWYQAPDYTNVSSIPWFEIVNWWADSFEIPRSTLWFFGALGLALAAGILVYAYGGQKILLTDLVVVIVLGIGIAMKLVTAYLILPFVIIAFAAIALGERL
ncbi:MAG: hypothetical protein PHQ22_10665 [Sulfuricurvum sp.]|nr:hypothetical protein [Sulfuricurvum sp.]